MAKDRFERTKPHVNVWAMDGLAQLGFSAVGVHQIATGQVVTDPADRALTAGILGDAQAHPSSGREQEYYTVTLTNGNVLPAQGLRFLTQVDRAQLQELGFSVLGAEQIATGQMISDPEDRSLVAEIVTAVASPLLAKALCNNEVI